MKNCLTIAALTLCLAHPHSAAGQDQDLRFEVASIKPAQPGAQFGRTRIPPGKIRYAGNAISLKYLILVAYGVRYWQIEGGPSWADDQYFDVDAKAARPSSNDEFHTMLRNLLEERFHLVVRRETKDSPVLELRSDKHGATMAEHQPPDLKASPVMKATSKDGKYGIEGSNVTMDDFAWYLSAWLRQMVINKTGLTGHYDLVLLSSGLPQGPEAAAPAAVTETLMDRLLFEDIPAQLGLKMVPANAPVEHLVIEHVEKLSEN